MCASLYFAAESFCDDFNDNRNKGNAGGKQVVQGTSHARITSCFQTVKTCRLNLQVLFTLPLLDKENAMTNP